MTEFAPTYTKAPIDAESAILADGWMAADAWMPGSSSGAKKALSSSAKASRGLSQTSWIPLHSGRSALVSRI